MRSVNSGGHSGPIDSGPKPGDFPVGSPQSRAAARLLMERSGEKRHDLILVWWPEPGDEQKPNAGEWERAEARSYRAGCRLQRVCAQ